MSTSNDIRGWSATNIPDRLKEKLEAVGGLNSYGEPMFRLLLAEDRYVLAAGEWQKWPEWASLDDRCGLGIREVQQMIQQGQRMVERQRTLGTPEEDLRKLAKDMNAQMDEYMKARMNVRPDRTDVGMEWVPLYPFEGFILEKWKPAHTFGSRDEWEQFKFGADCALGPYPEHGEYELVAGPTPYMPSASELETAVRNHFREIEKKAASPQQRVLQMMDRAEQKRKQRKAALADIAKVVFNDTNRIGRTLSLTAGKVRQQLADQAGLKGHYGN